MKSPSRIVLAIFAVVVLVAAITLVKQYPLDSSIQPSPKQSAEKRGADVGEVRLTFPKTIWDWEPPADGQFEQHSKGARDFWFQNDNPAPVELGLKAKSCKCSDVSVCILSPEESKRYRGAVPGKGDSDTSKLSTQPLAVDDLKGVTVGPGEGGFVRLAWEDKKEKEPQERNERLVVEIWAQAQGGGPRSITKLELPIVYVPALRITEAVMKVPDLYVNDKRTREFKCWSSTRPNFPLTAKERSGDPCFTCSCTPLSEAARKELEKTTRSHVLHGYTVQVTIHERIDDTVQMELGPFGRRILLTSAPDIEPTSVLIAGMVRGDVTVESEDERGGILLGPFSAKDGITKRVKLSGHRPDMELAVDRVEPEGSNHLIVKSLTKLDAPTVGGRTKWELCVEVPPGSPSGPLPAHSAVRLTIPGKPPRHIRIPVSGAATQ